MKSILRWGGTQLCQCPVLGRLFCLLPWWLSDTLTAPSGAQKKIKKRKHASELRNCSLFFGGGGTGVGHFGMKNGCSDMEITDSKQGGGADLRLWPPWPNLIAQLLEGRTYITYLKGSRELTIPKRSPDLPGVYVFFSKSRIIRSEKYSARGLRKATQQGELAWGSQVFIGRKDKSINKGRMFDWDPPPGFGSLDGFVFWQNKST